MKDIIKIAVETVNNRTKNPHTFVFAEHIGAMRLKRALIYMSAGKVQPGDTCAILDLTLMKTGEEGCLLSDGRLYFTRLIKPIDLERVIEVQSDKKTITVTYDGGSTVKVKIGRAALYVGEVINEIVRLRDGGAPEEKPTNLKGEVVVVKPHNNPLSFKL